jgi:DNA-binding beta-propeller fold protein YncE
MVASRLRNAATLVILSIWVTAYAAPVNTTIEDASATSRLYYLDQMGGRIQSCRTDGTDTRTVYTGLRSAPDGIAVDKAAGYIYVSNMGTSMGSGSAGSIVRVGMDGSGFTTLVAPGKTHTAKQLALVVAGGQKKLYWGDREGMRVMRCNVDGSGLETVVSTATSKCTGSAQCKHVVGVAVDTEGGWVYWTQKGGSSAGEGSIHRAPITLKAGETPDRRSDVQSLLTSLPEPIDMRWVASTGTLYWTDRSNSQGGNSVNRLSVSSSATTVQQIAATKQILYTGLNAGIGLAVDVQGKQMWATDLRGNLWASDMEGKGKKKIGSGLGVLVGIDYVE